MVEMFSKAPSNENIRVMNRDVRLYYLGIKYICIICEYM